MMGATPEQNKVAYDDEKPAHTVQLDSYYIGETEVTQALWRVVMGTSPSRYEGDALPVEQVSWNECQEFIERLNRFTGQTFSLPTEAQWEFAARGGNFSKGYKYAGSDILTEVAWWDANSKYQTYPVAQKLPNELGLYDMSGNVLEWCSDWNDNYSLSFQYNPMGPSSGSYHVIRGGSWNSNPLHCRVSNRWNDSNSRRNDIGLRLVLVTNSY
jgi:formylglycine-generating enzyme required for sulfatase activity